jgi:antitoxin (DNA-binding transcriptional repressor) of toxin-antitoxin stability system
LAYGAVVSTWSEIDECDLRVRSREIVEALERGDSFIFTRDGRGIGELVPLGARRRFVPRAVFTANSRAAPGVRLESFRTDQDSALD